MKAIMISIKPEWCEKICNYKKTIEIRKTMPKCALPIKVYIYCTKIKDKKRYTDEVDIPLETGMYMGNGRVIAEFILNQIDLVEICDPHIFRNGKQLDWYWFKRNACLDCEEIMSYIGYGCDYDGWASSEYAKGYAWHIDDLKIYNEPKELSEFVSNKVLSYDDWLYAIYNGHSGARNNYNSYLNVFRLKRPPQSWCYVEELKGESHA